MSWIWRCYIRWFLNKKKQNKTKNKPKKTNKNGAEHVYIAKLGKLGSFACLTVVAKWVYHSSLKSGKFGELLIMLVVERVGILLSLYLHWLAGSLLHGTENLHGILKTTVWLSI